MFAPELFTAISKFATRQGLQVVVLTSITGHVTARISGKEVWRRISFLIGKHCVQRVPPTETRGRRHTSYLVVAAFPVMEFSHQPLPQSELDTKTQRGHGPGGQHQNKTDSAVRMTHVPTGIKVFINGRDQHSNRAEALRVLTIRVRDHQRQLVDSNYRDLRMAQLGNAGRGEKIFTYNYLQDRAVDHRSGAKAKVRRVIIKGEFELLQ